MLGAAKEDDGRGGSGGRGSPPLAWGATDKDRIDEADDSQRDEFSPPHDFCRAQASSLQVVAAEDMVRNNNTVCEENIAAVVGTYTQPTPPQIWELVWIGVWIV